jgi:prepilin-type N-terminal cleavage/methylation domain-containing protein
MEKKLATITRNLQHKGGFTFFELIVVIGIISILAITLLVTLNPAEAQRRARDSKRIKDMQTIQVMIEQFLNDGSTIPTECDGNPAGETCDTDGIVATQQPCDSNWMNMDLCDYAKTVPIDPTNASRTCAIDTNADYDDDERLDNCSLIYRIVVNSVGDYEINVRQESDLNANKVANDGGDSGQWMEVFSSDNSLMTD